MFTFIYSRYCVYLHTVFTINESRQIEKAASSKKLYIFILNLIHFINPKQEVSQLSIPVLS